MVRELNKFQKALGKVILSHPIWGAFVAFSLMFTTCYMGNTIALWLFDFGTNDTIKILIPSVSFAIVLVVASRRNMKGGKI